MSFASLSSTSLFSTGAKYPSVIANSLGSVRLPTIDATSTASNVAVPAFTAVTLPAGVYQVSGAIRVTSAAVLTDFLIRIQVAGSNVARLVGDVSAAAATSLQIPFSYTFSTTGSSSFGVSVLCQTTGAANYNIVDTNGDSWVSIVRVA